ncbi:MAG: hypothetical protein JWO44_2671 [Bacteroidetes bacterium]|nr:hypothetical protein [Bacteroidota bacterium]
MKRVTTVLKFSILAVFILLCPEIKAQDTILKTDGSVIYAKIIEMGNNAVSYKRSDFEDGPTFVENKSNIAIIKFRNGTRQEFVKVETPSNNNGTQNNNGTGNSQNNGNGTTNSSAKTNNSTNNQNTSSDPLKNGPVNNGNSKIEIVDGKYMMNGQKLGRKALDRELKKSTNPLVQVSLKTAKLAKVSQKIVGITAIPSTIAGGVTSIITISQAVTAYQTGKMTPQYYVNAGLSFLGTLTVPITSKILKKQRDKLYKKTIDLYNMGN